MHPPWRIELLGELRAVRGGRVVTRFRTQKTGLLLAYLAYDPRRVHRREQLCEWLWPEGDPELSRHNLRNLLHWLRQELEPAGDPDGVLLLTDRHTVRVDPAAVTTDVAEFSAALEAAARAGESAERARSLARAVDLYRGEFLTGFFDDWVLQEREWLAGRYFQALSQLIALLERGGESERAVEFARRGVWADPLREEAHHDLIRLLAATGQRETALRQYEELKRRLAHDLGDEPSAELHALAATLRQQLSRPVSPAAPEPALPPVPPVPGSLLPLPLDRFFGRRPELARLIALLRPLTTGSGGEEEAFEENAPPRLITLSGPGGSGKTRLALEVARRLQPRSRVPIWFVPLQGLTPAVAPPTGGTPPRPPILEEVRDAMRLPRTPEADPLEQVVSALRDQLALLILDNFEHLVEGGAPLLQMLLQRAPTLTLLVASRRRLHLPGEQELPVMPLPVPVEAVSSQRSALSGDEERAGDLTSEPSPLTSNPSFQLFVDRAQVARPGFQLTPNSTAEVARLCARLEGMPLAIELAAGRAGVLTPGQMLERLADPFALLVNRRRGGEARHQSLRATLDWSFQLLPAELQQFFCRLSVFRGGWTLEAAEAIADCGVQIAECPTDPIRPPPCALRSRALEYLEQLRECSLMVVDETKGEMRYRLLETLREYGAERLSAAEQEALSGRHAAFFPALAEEAERWMHSAERYVWLERLEPELDNFRAALSWCLGSSVGQAPPEHRNPRTPEPLTLGLRLSSALTEFWQHSGHAGEGRDWLQRLLEYAEGLGRTALRAKTVGAAGRLAMAQYDETGSISLLEESVALWRQLGDRQELARSLSLLGLNKVYTRDLAEARTLLDECVVLLREGNNRWLLMHAINNRGRLEEIEGNLAQARANLEEARSLNPGVGAEEIVASIIYRLGSVAQQEGRLEEAREQYVQSIAVSAKLPAADHTGPLRGLGQTARLGGDYTEARARLEKCLSLRQRLGHLTTLPETLFQLADVVRCQADFTTARSLAEQSLAIARARDEHPEFEAEALRVLGRVAYDQGDLQQARRLLEKARFHAPGSLLVWSDLAEALARLGEHGKARAILDARLEALRSGENYLDLSYLLRSRGRVELRCGEWQLAAASFRESLSLLHHRGIREGAPECLEGLARAVLGAGVGQPQNSGDAAVRLAARLLGAAEALREGMGTPLPPVYRTDHEATVACLGTVLKDQELAAAWAEGRGMPLEQAIADALKLEDARPLPS
jgi:predicted ATPase/DNA-binding SARP family transcriptional activator/Flp pilus assembly protein TadD